MPRIENQRILVYCNEVTSLQNTIFDAVTFALKLNLELCFFANYLSEKERLILQERVTAYSQIIEKDIPNLPVSVLLLEGKLAKLMTDLGFKYNAVLLFCGNKMSTYLMKAFYQSGFPFFFSKGRKSMQPTFKNVLIPIDFRNNTKEAILWGSYAGRFLDADVTLLKAQETNTDDKLKTDKITAFVKRLYGQFLFTYRIEQGKNNSWGIHQEGLKLAEEFDLLIFTGSLNVSLLDQIIEPFEKRLVNSDSQTSILLINPQKELCVLCD